MKIIYGVSGDGFGHSSRASEMINFLEGKGNEVLVLTYSQAYDVMKEKFDVFKIEGITLKFRKGKLSLSKTFSSGIKPVVENIKSFKGVSEKISSFKPDVFITDYEPFTAMLSYYFKKPLVSIDNQHRLTHLKVEVPKKYKKEFDVARTATRVNPPRADKYIILSFAKLPAEKKAVVVSPILRDSIINLKTSKEDKILVYQTKPDLSLIRILKKIPENFVSYGYDVEKKEGNVIFRKAGSQFIEDLASAKAVIATAGFTLISESLYLKKPYFALPLKGQFEQVLNALFLKSSGCGDYSDSPSKEEIESFIKNIQKYEKAMKKFTFDPKEAFGVMEKVLCKFSKTI